MAIFIAGAMLLGSAYQASEARKSARAARAVAEREAAILEQQTRAQIEAQQETANLARERLSTEKAKYEEQKAAMEKESTRIAQELEAERRKMGEQESSKMRARIRGGKRSLLSEERLNPEVGLLGTGVSYG